MNARRTRIQRVVTHRGQELDQRVKNLEQQKAARFSAEEQLAREQALREGAERLRQDLLSGVVNAEEWTRANEWLKGRVLERARAEQRLKLAEGRAQKAHQEVVQAHSQLRQVELLQEKLGREEQKAEELSEQRLHDELAIQKSARRDGGR